MSRKPWEIPVIYNDDRWLEPGPGDRNDSSGNPNPGFREPSDDGSDDANGRDVGDVEELLRRPDDPDRHGNKTTDNTPLNYGRGPHDDEFGVDEDESPDQVPVNYDSQPHDDEFGLDDDDELDESKLEPADDDDSDWDD
jgi:hypothetical protein